MKSIICQRVILLTILSVFSLKAYSQIQTVIVAQQVSIDKFDASAPLTMNFSFAALPATARISAAYLTFHLNTERENIIPITIVVSSGTGTLNSRSVTDKMKDYPDMKLNILTSFIEENRGKKVAISIKTEGHGSGAIGFSGHNNPNFSPRLVIEYTDTKSDAYVWGQPRGNWMHQNQAVIKNSVKDPKYLNAEILEDITAPDKVNEISSQFSCYDGKVLFYSKGMNSGTVAKFNYLDRFSTFNRLNPAQIDETTPPLVNLQGDIIFPMRNEVAVFDQEGMKSKRIDFKIDKPYTQMPCLGPDGSLYLVSDDGLLALSQPADGKNDLAVKWFFDNTGYKIQSALTLDRYGKFGYFISKRNGALVKINTINGTVEKTVPVVFNPKDASQPYGPISMIDFKGNLFVNNGILESDSMFVYDSTLTRVRAYGGKHISQPALGDNDVFFVIDNRLIKYSTDNRDTNFVALLDSQPMEVNSLVCDLDNNIYCWSAKGASLYGYHNATQRVLKNAYKDPEFNSGFQRNIAVDQNGYAYTATSSKLVRFGFSNQESSGKPEIKKYYPGYRMGKNTRLCSDDLSTCLVLEEKRLVLYCYNRAIWFQDNPAGPRPETGGLDKEGVFRLYDHWGKANERYWNSGKSGKNAWFEVWPGRVIVRNDDGIIWSSNGRLSLTETFYRDRYYPGFKMLVEQPMYSEDSLTRFVLHGDREHKLAVYYLGKQVWEVPYFAGNPPESCGLGEDGIVRLYNFSGRSLNYWNSGKGGKDAWLEVRTGRIVVRNDQEVIWASDGKLTLEELPQIKRFNPGFSLNANVSGNDNIIIREGNSNTVLQLDNKQLKLSYDNRTLWEVKNNIECSGNCSMKTSFNIEEDGNLIYWFGPYKLWQSNTAGAKGIYLEMRKGFLNVSDGRKTYFQKK